MIFKKQAKKISLLFCFIDQFSQSLTVMDIGTRHGIIRDEFPCINITGCASGAKKALA